MTSRKEYFEEYRRKNKIRLSKYAHRKYEETKMNRLQYQKEYDSLHRESISDRRSIKTEIIRKAKDKPCMDCGLSYPSYIMQFDHRDPIFKCFNVAQMSSHSVKKLLVEIDKCDVVCANCHAERTWGKRK